MIPDYQRVMRPVLALLADGQVRRARDLSGQVADHFHLTEEERGALIPSGGERIIHNRVGWAITYMVRAGLIERPQRGYVRITSAGKRALMDNPERIENRVLDQYERFRAFRSRSTKELTATGSPGFSSNFG